MKHFRHSPLAAWSLVLLGMLAVGVAALFVHGTPSPRPAGYISPVDRSTVMSIRSRMISLHVAATPPSSGLPTWAAATSAEVESAAAGRLQRSSKSDRLYRAYLGMDQDVKALAGVDVSSALTVQTSVALVEADADTLTGIVEGNAPSFAPLPGESLAPVSPSTGNYTLPVQPAPGISAVPFNPAQPAQPEQPGVPTTGGTR